MWLVTRVSYIRDFVVVTFEMNEGRTETNLCQKFHPTSTISECATSILFSFHSALHLLRVTGCWGENL